MAVQAQYPSDAFAADFRTSSGAIIIDEIAIEEGGSANIKSGSQIISGPTREGHLSYTFLLCHTQEHKDERLKAILQSFSAFKRSDEELMLLDRNASNQLNPVVSRKLQTRKRPFSTSSYEMHEIESCPQCGSTLGGFRCNQSTTHLQCQACQGMMPSRSDIGVPQKCLGCDRAFCGAYWQAHGVDATTFGPVCSPQTFKSISERTITRIPELTHENNRYEQEIDVVRGDVVFRQHGPKAAPLKCPPVSIIGHNLEGKSWVFLACAT
ncbi:hypothetical protein QJS10_CPA08g00484 [Acorus calamus]|uniref:E3 ubiquitin-protein ligase CHFR cysteine rich domain-containing protein n=1 Tax=Acorus calamus TaxID=4465 RepID=A0AAV9E9C6_ACOCL|nr:hypothetical protein QJS10_CPA08g00484 [Acorus calamus]